MALLGYLLGTLCAVAIIGVIYANVIAIATILVCAVGATVIKFLEY